MQFLKISNSTKLSQLANIVGERNVEHVLVANDLARTPNIGKALSSKCDEYARSNAPVSWEKKSSILNTFTQDSDIFETAALLGESAWKVLANLGTFPGMLRVPETIPLPDSVDLIGNGIGIGKVVYEAAMKMLRTEPHTIDPSIFNDYSANKQSKIISHVNYNNNVFQWFHLPWGDITLYSHLSQESIDFPVYPEEMSDGVSANFTQMPDMLYQYEPWQVYQSSGPRQNKYTFDMHRDMWTGDHRDGKLNDLIRFCEANCYAQYNGSAVNVSLVTLYIKGSALITGVVNNVDVSWDGPIGLDGYYLHCTLTITITEVSQQALNYTSVRNKPLIG